MDKKEILEKIGDIVREVLDRNDIEITEETASYDVEGWDSLVNAQIVFSVQEEFGIKFSAREMISWDNVGDMCNTIASRI